MSDACTVVYLYMKSVQLSPPSIRNAYRPTLTVNAWCTIDRAQMK